MSLTSPDFESGAYTNFATPAARGKMISRAVRESQQEGAAPKARINAESADQTKRILIWVIRVPSQHDDRSLPVQESVPEWGIS